MSLKSTTMFFLALTMLAFMIPAESFAEMDRVKVQDNERLMQTLLQDNATKQGLAAVATVAEERGYDLELTWVSSKVKGIREELGLDEENNIGQKHQFIYSQGDSIQCSFSVYVIWQNTMPMSIAKKHSELYSPESPVRCEEY